MDSSTSFRVMEGSTVVGLFRSRVDAVNFINACRLIETPSTRRSLYLVYPTELLDRAAQYLQTLVDRRNTAGSATA